VEKNNGLELVCQYKSKHASRSNKNQSNLAATSVTNSTAVFK